MALPSAASAGTASAGSGTTSASLTSVACVSASSCMAVGGYDFTSKPSVALPLAEHWNGHKWSVVKIAAPAGATTSELRSVACKSASSCTAVGEFYASNLSPSSALIEHWNGTKWSLETPAAIAGASASALEDVACDGISSCTAVGYYVNGADDSQNVAEHWNGSKWSLEGTPDYSKLQSDLNGVACPSASSCTAVGQAWNSAEAWVTFAEHWNGHKWSLEVTPDAPGAVENFPAGVACASATNCMSAGYTLSNHDTIRLTLAEHMSGTAWKLEKTLNPSAALEPGNDLSRVACTSTSSCTAVGWDENGHYLDLTLAEHWNGSSWAVMKTSNPSAGTEGSQLSGIACTSASNCTAVGYDANNKLVDAALAEHWNGHTWALMVTATP
ncbi:MAG: hypothetical protein ABSE47_12810 [Acidimicrobiales bacterium]